MIKQPNFKKSTTRKFKTRPSSRTALKTVIALFFMLPLMFTLFILDRIILLPMLGKIAPSFQLWYDNNTEMARSVIRVLVGYSVIGLVAGVVWLVQNIF